MKHEPHQSMWDRRYGEPGFAYGTEPNQFLAATARQIPLGPVLSLGEGEGRNAMFLASLGFDVVAVDQSPVGLAKATQMARERGLSITKAYTPAQLGRGTGGPPDPQMLSTVASLQRELAGLEFVLARELEREVVEGRHHTGLAAVVQLLARRA